MKIQIGKIVLTEVTNQKAIIYPYKNKTKKYLLPALKVYGPRFTNMMNTVFKVAVGIGDMICRNAGKVHEKHIFILIDTAIATGHFLDFIGWIRTQASYEDDYPYGNLQKSTLHMIIIKFPEELYGALDEFNVGGYSKMYTDVQIRKFFDKHPDILRVVVKDRNYIFEFTEKLNRIYGTNIAATDYEGELDLPPREELEIFDHHLQRKNKDDEQERNQDAGTN